MNAKQGCSEIMGWIVDGLTIAGAIFFFAMVWKYRDWVMDAALLLVCVGMIFLIIISVISLRRMRKWIRSSQ